MKKSKRKSDIGYATCVMKIGFAKLNQPFQPAKSGKKMSKKSFIPITYFVIALTLCLVLALTVELQIANKAKIQTLHVTAWQDPNCTTPLTEIDWGTIDAGQTKTYTAYLKTEANQNATIYSWASEWSPDGIQQYLTYNFNKNNTIIQPYTPLQVVFSLTVSENIPASYSNFTFTIHIIATV